MKHFFVTGLLFLSVQAGAQSFERTLEQGSVDFNHYSVENSGKEYVLAGTKFYNSASNNDIHIMKMDAGGNMMWEQYIDVSRDDRALDVTVDDKDNVIVCGYVLGRGPVGTIARPYVVKLDPNGNFIADLTIAGPMPYHANGAGTNIIFSKTKQVYIVGGFFAGNFAAPLANNDAFVCEIPLSLSGGATWATTFTGPQQTHSSINDIVEVPSKGYFVTGSFDRTLWGGNPGSAVIAYFIDFGGNPIHDLSFNSSNSTHQGVSAVYVPNDDYIYLMSNNSGYHNPQLTLIAEVSGPSPSIVSNYYLELDPSYGQMNAAGLQLRHSATDPKNLVAAGNFRNYPIIYDPTMSTWISEFDKYTGTNIETWVRPASAPGAQFQGGSLLADFYGQFPYIYDPEILAYNSVNSGYCFLGPTTATAGSTDYSMQIESTVLPPKPGSTCLKQYPMTPYTLSHSPEPPIVMVGTAKLNKLVAPVKQDNTPIVKTCELLKPAPTEIGKTGDAERLGINVYPNPTSDILNVELQARRATRITLNVYDMLGRQVSMQEYKVSAGTASLKLDITTLSNGLYMLMASDDNGTVYPNIKIEKH